MPSSIGEIIRRHYKSDHPESDVLKPSLPKPRIPARPKKSDVPEFALGKYVININSGHVWQILNKNDLETVIEGWKNGQRHIVLYV